MKDLLRLERPFLDLPDPAPKAQKGVDPSLLSEIARSKFQFITQFSCLSTARQEITFGKLEFVCV